MIGIFDSGIGGLSVLKAIREKMPQADIVYFGDTENAPYGNKSKEEISKLFAMALQRLYKEGCTDIVSACNSASVSVHAIPIDLLRLHVFNVVEMIEPTVEALASQSKKIALLGTQATIDSHIYQKVFAEKGITIEPIAIPALAGCIEKGAPEGEMLEILRPALQEALQKGAEIISLSCTHYSLIQDMFEKILRAEKNSAQLFDPSKVVAEEVSRRFSKEGSGKLRFLVSKESAVFGSYVEKLFGVAPYSIELAGSIYWSLPLH